MKRFNAVCCGRRYGKTILGTNRLIPPALEGYPVAWFAPTYKYLREVWNDFVRILQPLNPSCNKSERRIELCTGGVIEFWSLQDEDAGRSRKYKRVVIDEAAKVKNLKTAWFEAIRPTLADMRGDADLYSTPKGKDFFFECFCQGIDPLEPEWAAWQMPTSTNPFIHPDEIEELRRKLPERVYAQEILAQFLDDAGGVFRGVNAVVDKGRIANEKAKPHLIYSQGSDLARIEDFTVNSILDQNGRQVFFDRFNQISWTRQVEAIAEASRSFNNAAVNLDTTGIGDPIYEALRKQKMGTIKPFVFSNASKEALIDNLAMMIEQGRVHLMDVPEQVNELLAFEYEILPSRKVRMQAPEGLHDDCVISLALAAWGLGKTKKPGFL
jgi:hypothetical protein